jgi:AcrR family transcriptional regulator
MAPRPDVSAERKQQIYQAALACFGRQGYYQTTMDDIVAESGLSKGALYWYFGGKKELFLSLFQEIMAQFGEGWASLVSDEGTSATEKLRASMELFRTALAEMVPFFGVMMEAWALTRHDPDVESLMGEFYTPYLEIMDRIIEQGIASGEFRVASARATSLVVMTLFDGITLAMATGLWQHDWDEIVDAAEDLVLRGLGVTGGYGG